MNESKKTPDENGTKQQIMMAALRIFSQKGYSSTTIRNILDASGTSAPSLYHYFKNKEGLFQELARTHLEEFHYLVFDSHEDDSPSAKIKLKNMADRTFSFVTEHRDFSRLMFSIYYGPPKGNPSLNFKDYIVVDIQLKMHTYIRKTILEGIKAKEFKPGNQNAMAWCIRGMIQLALNETVKDDSIKKIDRETLQTYLDVILKQF